MTTVKLNTKDGEFEMSEELARMAPLLRDTIDESGTDELIPSTKLAPKKLWAYFCPIKPNIEKLINQTYKSKTFVESKKQDNSKLYVSIIVVIGIVIIAILVILVFAFKIKVK